MNSFFKGMIKGLFIAFVIICVLYVVSYKKWLNEDLDDIVVTYKEEEGVVKPTEEVIDFKPLYSKVNFNFLEENFGSEFYGMYYDNVPFSPEYYLFVAVINIIHKDLITECNYSRELSAVEVEWKAKEIFGDIDFKKISFETKDKHMSITYDKDKDIFIIKTNSCSGFDYKNGGIYNIPTGYINKGDYIYVDEKAIYLDYSYDINGNLIFNYHDGLDRTSKVISNSADQIDLTKLHTYNLKFKKDNGAYHFVGIEK